VHIATDGANLPADLERGLAEVKSISKKQVTQKAKK
jgi:hypothetical protein